jgi:hypothetical protein
MLPEGRGQFFNSPLGAKFDPQGWSYSVGEFNPGGVEQFPYGTKFTSEAKLHPWGQTHVVKKWPQFFKTVFRANGKTSRLARLGAFPPRLKVSAYVDPFLKTDLCCPVPAGNVIPHSTNPWHSSKLRTYDPKLQLQRCKNLITTSSRVRFLVKKIFSSTFKKCSSLCTTTPQKLNHFIMTESASQKIPQHVVQSFDWSAEINLSKQLFMAKWHCYQK